MKRIIFEYFAIPLAVKSYMLIGAGLYKARVMKEKIAKMNFSLHKAKVKPTIANHSA